MRWAFLLGLLLVLLLAGPSWATHKSFVWDAVTLNEDGTPVTDLAGYRVYTCTATPCTLATAVRLGEVGVTTLALYAPHGKQGFAFATCFDSQFNESAESNVIPFDTLRPGKPGNFRIP